MSTVFARSVVTVSAVTVSTVTVSTVRILKERYALFISSDFRENKYTELAAS